MTARSETPTRSRMRPRSRTATVTVLSAVVVLVVAVIAVAIGSTTLPIGDVMRALVGAADPTQQFIVLTFRLPRVVCALLVGACLGLAGALTQTFSRNPLATPDILGVTSGAAVGAVVTIVIGGGGYAVGASLLGFGIPVVATVFGLATSAVVYGLSWRGGVDSYRLILIGIGATAALTGVTSYLLVQAQITQASAAAHWLAGSLAGISWTSIWPVLVVLVVVAPIAAAQSPALEVSGLGDDLSVGLGVALQRHRLIVIACAVVLTSAAVSASGPVDFVAFVAPQVAARLARRGRPPLAASALLGASLVVIADLVGRAVFPWEVPVGIITAIVGAPYLIWLITRHRSQEGTS
ncbi:MAG TPA: iron ABC transporter permease [Lacisediminihabitans sp.]|uniref:FecCD family ABC transporter permease n=1 Tax=Lacisediminihabitans sp. TaxID=2787631 RepID=UPI002EDAA304